MSDETRADREVEAIAALRRIEALCDEADHAGPDTSLDIDAFLMVATVRAALAGMSWSWQCGWCGVTGSGSQEDHVCGLPASHPQSGTESLRALRTKVALRAESAERSFSVHAPSEATALRGVLADVDALLAAAPAPTDDPACCCEQTTARLLVCPVHPERMEAWLQTRRDADPEFMARIKASVEQHRPILDRLAEDDGPTPAPAQDA